ncbi:MAG: peptide deformylase [Planctomycetota bacterium]
MAVDPDSLRIVHYPDPVLREPAAPVDPADPHVQAVARRMIDLMHQAQGVGLAAPQVGLPWRLFVANPTGQPDDDRVYFNPVLSDPDPETEPADEGCLSLPGVTVLVTRPRAVQIDAVNLAGEAFTERSDNLLARIWQHETDHLDGRLILDRMNAADRIANRRAIRELEAARP